MTDDEYEDMGIAVQGRKKKGDQFVGQRVAPLNPLPGRWSDNPAQGRTEGDTESPNMGKDPTFKDPTSDTDTGGPAVKGRYGHDAAVTKADGWGIGQGRAERPPGIYVVKPERPSADPGGMTAPSQVAMHTVGEVGSLPRSTPRASPDEVPDQPDANAKPERGSRIEERPQDLRSRPTQSRRPDSNVRPGQESRTPSEDPPRPEPVTRPVEEEGRTDAERGPAPPGDRYITVPTRSRVGSTETTPAPLGTRIFAEKPRRPDSNIHPDEEDRAT